MPTTTLMPLPKQQFLSAIGTPLIGGKVYTYAAGGTNPKATYTDSAGTTPQQNPITLNLRGEPPSPIYWSGNYRVDVRDALGNLVYSVDNYNTDPAGVWGLATSILAQFAVNAGSALIGFIQAAAGAVKRTVQDKLREGYASPEDFANGIASGADWSDALQKAFNSGKNIWLTPGIVYGVTKEITSTKNDIIVTGGGTIKILPTYDVSGNTLSVLSITGENTTLDAVTFDGTGGPHGSLNNRFVWCTAPRLKVTENASFINLPKGGTNFNGAIGCNSLAPYASVIGAYFYNNPGAVFYQGRNCVANNNRIINPNDVAIAFNGPNCVGCLAVGNSIDNEALNSCSALIAAEEGASEWVIEGNRLKGIKDGCGISALNLAVLTDVRGGRIVGNVINGASSVTTNPCALISISPHYIDTLISGNELLGCPSGSSSNRLIIVPATGTEISNNLIDGASVAGLAAMVEISPGTRGLTYKDNVSRCAAGGRHVMVDGGDYTGNPVSFEGGKFFGGAEGINTELNAATITNLDLRIVNLADSTATLILNCATLLGDRSAWMNAGAYLRPHRIGVFTEMHGTGVPAAGTFYNGDKIYYLSPAYPGGYIGLIKAQGAWHSFGLLA